MKTLVVLLTLAAVAAASPAVFPKDLDTIKHTNKLDDIAELHRQKKSPLEETSQLTGQNLEDGSLNTNLEERHVGLKKPIVIKKKFGIHHLRNADTLEEREAKKECETTVKVNVCNDEAETPSKIMKPATAPRSDIIMSENEMENSIQMAKEAVENLHRDFLNMEKKSQIAHSRSDTELDSELHSNIEIARKALENIHHNFGDLESMSLKRESTTDEDGLKKTLSEVERLAQWKEAMENVQRDMEIARNIEDAFKPEESKKDRIEKEDAVKEQLRSDADTDETKEFAKDMKFVQSLDKNNDQTVESEKQRSDLASTHMMQTETNNEQFKKDSQLKMMDDIEIATPVLQATQEKNGAFTMKANEPMEFTKQMQERREPVNTLWAQEKSSDDGKQKLFDTLSMRMSENDHKRQETPKPTETKKHLIDHHETRMTPDMHIQDQMSFKMSPTNMMQQQNLNMHQQGLNMHQQHFSHMPMPVHGHHMPKQFGGVGMNFDQNNVNVFQNQDNSMMEMNQQQTAEDPFFMRWAEEQRNAMAAPNGMNLQANFRGAQMDELMDPVSQFEMAGHDDLSALGVHDHDHVHVMQHADPAMQTSMRMNMLARPTHEHSALQWANQGLARSSYGGAGSSGSSDSSGSGGAVGVFPNAKVGGCAIPILVSCSPSLATGTLAKAQPSYSSGYRSGDNMVYYMKRDAKEGDLPILKVQKTHAPYNHKTELILEKTHE